MTLVALYSTLHATYVILIGMITGQYEALMIVYILVIYIGYVLIFYKKIVD